MLAGSQMMVKLPDSSLRVALALTLALAGVKLIDPPGANAIVIAVAVGALITAVVATSRRLARRPVPVRAD